MASDELDLVHSRAMEHGLAPRIGFQDPALHFPRASGGLASAPKRRAAGFASDRNGGFFPMAPNSHLHGRRWNEIRDPGSPSGEESEEDDEDEYDDGLVSVDDGNNKNSNNSSGSGQSSSEKVCNQRADSREQHSGFGLSRGVAEKDRSGMTGCLGEQQQQDRACGYENEIAAVEPENYYTPILHGGDALSLVQKVIGGENGCGFGRRRDIGLAGYSGESVKMHLSDPVTGVLMDDAMILPCGHSFGSGGMQHVHRMKSCFKCAQPVSEDLVRPNLALRSAVQAFRQEEESPYSKSSKRRRDRYEQEKSIYDDSFPIDLSRGKGVQFPFVVSDRVIIKGNKRTPQRFVGRVAVVTTQCLNGWYVVKTLDNAESVKLQYRSLAKVTDDTPRNTTTNKPATPNWL